VGFADNIITTLDSLKLYFIYIYLLIFKKYVALVNHQHNVVNVVRFFNTILIF